MKEIKCEICNKLIKEDDQILLGSKDNIFILPPNATSANLAFMHFECMQKKVKEKNEAESK